MNNLLAEYTAAINQYLEHRFPDSDVLSESMRYSLLSGGKRLRPVLVLEFARLCGGDVTAAVPVACAVEMLHCYSLIHDDMPFMDNDDTRRGKPANHIVYGDTVAALAGDCLQAEAFASMCSAPLGEAERLRCCALLAEAAGLNGICGGQRDDLAGPETAEALLKTDERKTAALIAGACAMGAAAAGADPETVAQAKAFGFALGMAFQLRDDVLDGDGLCALYGAETCEARILSYTEAALTALSAFPDSDFLREYTQNLAVRLT